MRTLKRLLAAIGLGHSRDADVGALLDIGQRGLDNCRDRRLLRQRNLQLAAAAGLDDVDITLDAVDGTAHPDRLILRAGHRLGQCEEQSDYSCHTQYQLEHIILLFPYQAVRRRQIGDNSTAPVRVPPRTFSVV